LSDHRFALLDGFLVLIQQQLVLLHKDPTLIRNDVVLLDHQVVLIHKGHTPFGYQFIWMNGHERSHHFDCLGYASFVVHKVVAHLVKISSWTVAQHLRPDKGERDYLGP
jgi:hypothetical protein